MQFIYLLAPVVLTIMGFLLLLLSIHMSYTEHIMKKRGKKYSGKVVDEAQNGIDDGYEYRPMYDPVIEYQNDKNETKRIRSPVGIGSKCNIGETIDLCEYKDKVFIDQKPEHFALKYGLALFGVMLLWTGVYFIFH
jgi:hypothetical protein